MNESKFSKSLPWIWKSSKQKTITITLSVGAIVILVIGWQIIAAVIVMILGFLIGISIKMHHNYATEPLAMKRSRRASVHWKQVQYLSRKDNDDIIDDKFPEEKVLEIQQSRSKMDMRMTGSALIDETIHEMIDYILRDYIHSSWYDFISDDDEFIHELRRNLQLTLVTLSSRVKEVDWIPYLTTILVDDSASHLRLYRQSKMKLRENPNSDLISVFFDFEASMEKNLCRDMVCTDDSYLTDYFQGLCEGVLYLLLPQEIYACSPIASLVQDVIVHHVLQPVLQLLSEPDFVNQCIVWLFQEFVDSPEIFMTVIRTCDSMDEICAAEDFFDNEMSSLKSLIEKATSNEDGNNLHRQLRCLSYVLKAIEQQRNHLKEGKPGDWAYEGEIDEWQQYCLSPGVKVRSLSLEEVLKNSVALSYFLDYMSAVGGHHYLLLYLNADAWKVSGEVQLIEIETSARNPQSTKGGADKSNQAMLDCMKDAALNIYEQFLSDKAVPKVKLPDNIVKRFYIQVRTEKISSTLFDEVQEALLDTMQNVEKFFPSFTRNKLYIKCLLELDLLKEDTSSTHSASSASDDEDELEIVSSSSLSSHGDIVDPTNFKCQFDLPEFQTCRECLRLRKRVSGLKPEDILLWEKVLLAKKYRLKAEIIEAALRVDKGKTFGLYVVLATRIEEGEEEEKKWHIYRRYSDFYDFHLWIKSKWMRLNKVEFPSKQTFGKTDRIFLEKRMLALNKYLNAIFSITSEQCFGESLQDSILHFLEPGSYTIKKTLLSEKIDTFVNPLKQSVKTVTEAVRTMPDTLLNTVDGLTKIFHSKNVESDFTESIKVGAAIDIEADDNIPLRIILLLMDEVFDLKSRNQWLRRRLVVMIRQIIKTMIGDNLNRRIVDHVALLTSPVRVAGYLQTLQEALWPAGKKIESRYSRNSDTKQKTKIAAKTALLSSLPDEMKHLIGSDTTRRGLLSVFELCQNRVLNKRLLIVLLEGVIKTLYPDKPFHQLIQRLHFRSNRVGKYRPFVVPSTLSAKTTTMPMINLSPRGTRKRKP